MARIKPPASVNVGNNPALKRLDANNDGKVDKKDFPNMSEAQVEGVMVAAAALAEPGVQPAPDGFDFAGKKVVFSGLEGMSKADAKKLASDAGAKVASGLSRGVDILVVGDTDRTGKDEKAIQMNASGLASIRLMTESDFKRIAGAATAHNAIDIGGAGAPFESLYFEDKDDYFQISAAVTKKARAAMETAAEEYFDAFGEDTGFASAQEAKDAIGDMSIYRLKDDTLTLVAGYGFGAYFADVDVASGDITDAWEHS